MPLFQSVLTVLADPFTPWFMAGLILLLTLGLWFGFAYRVARVERRVNHAIRVLEGVQGQGAFRQRFGEIFKALAEDPILGGRWRSFAATLMPVPGGDEAYGYTRRPHEDLDDRLLAAAGLDLRFFEAVPGLLVGLGLLLTFLGLIAALQFAAAGVAAPDVRDAQAALRQLLGAAAFKFITSVAGIACSIAFSWAEKRRLYGFRRRLQRLNTLLEARLQPLTAGALMVRQIDEIRRLGQGVERLSKGVFLRVPESIEAQLLERLDLALVPLKTALARASARLERLDEQVVQHLGASLATPRSSNPLPPAPPPTTDAEALGVLDHRLDGVADALSGALARLAGKRHPAERRAAEAIASCDARLREARSTLRKAFNSGADAGDTALGEALRDLDQALATGRTALRAALEQGPGGSA